MKRTVALLLLIAVCVFSLLLAHAEEPTLEQMTENLRTMFRSYSYEELSAIRDIMFSLLNEEITSRPEWRETTVPAGHWKVGQDIPAGAYSVRAANTSVSSRTLFNCENASGNTVEYMYLSSDRQLGKIELLEGYTVEVNAPVIFAPPVALQF